MSVLEPPKPAFSLSEDFFLKSEPVTPELEKQRLEAVLGIVRNQNKSPAAAPRKRAVAKRVAKPARRKK